jgi:phenylacetate-CoA ligase
MTLSQAPSTVLGSSDLSLLINRARDTIPFYRDHIAAADLPVVPSFAKHNTAGYGAFPLTANGESGAHRVVATSGTTGDRLYLAFDREDHARVGRWLERVGRQAGLGSSDVLLNTHCYGLWVGGPVLDLLADQAQACVVPLGPGPAAGVLHMLRAGIGTAISATPSYLRRLVEAAEVSDVDLSATGLRLGFIGAEPAEPALRKKLLSRMPADFRWVELYGLTETLGPSVAFGTDTDIPELELNTGDFHVEVLEREADAPVPLGEIGELTLTCLHSCRSPLIRYRTRDLVRVRSGTATAPTRISTILGRADDSLKIGGILTYPAAVAEIITGMLSPTAEWRAVVRRYGSDGELRNDDELLIEAEALPSQCAEIERTFHERVGLTVRVVPTDGSTIVRSLKKTRRFCVEHMSDEPPPVGRSTCG